HEVKHLMVGEPVDPEDDETNHEGRKPRPEIDEPLRQASRAERLRRPQLEHEDCHGNGEHTVHERLEAILRQSVRLRRSELRRSPPRRQWNRTLKTRATPAVRSRRTWVETS